MKYFFRKLVVVGSGLFVFCACQTQPTKVFESNEPRQEGKVAPISANAVILDARPAFDFSLSHINGSLNVRWDDFTQQQEPFRGLFEKDLFFHARRLARMGIGPDTPVVVVGRGPQGGGEEGRLAWTLKYLGIKDVRFMHIDAFDRPTTREEAAPKMSVTVWKPELDASMIISRAEFLKKSMVPKDQLESPVIIDTRPSAEYLGKTPSPFPVRPPDIGAVNIPWTEFITSQGVANIEIKTKLAAVGITPEKEILCLSNRGVESATATLVLRELGYSKAANYAGGFADLLAEPKRATNQRAK